jgi:hypothetical protein
MRRFSRVTVAKLARRSRGCDSATESAESTTSEIHGRDRLRGLLREYYRAAAVRRDKNNGALRRSGGNQDPSAHRRVAPGASRLRDLDFRLAQRSRYLPVEDVVDRILQAQLLALPPGLWCDFA